MARMSMPKRHRFIGVAVAAGRQVGLALTICLIGGASYAAPRKPVKKSAPVAVQEAAPAPAPASAILALATSFDPESFMGLWYKAAKVESPKAQLRTRERYELMLRYDGAIRVISTAYLPLDNQWKRQEDYMEPVDQNGAVIASVQKMGFPIRFRISRFGSFFRSDYRTIAIDAAYQWALVTGPDPDSFFVLSRTPVIAESLRDALTQLSKRSIPNLGPIRWVSSDAN